MNQEQRPICPDCAVPMNLRHGRYGWFWFCELCPITVDKGQEWRLGNQVSKGPSEGVAKQILGRTEGGTAAIVLVLKADGSIASAVSGATARDVALADDLRRQMKRLVERGLKARGTPC